VFAFLEFLIDWRARAFSNKKEIVVGTGIQKRNYMGRPKGEPQLNTGGVVRMRLPLGGLVYTPLARRVL
jgi:hypothetical protein